MHIFYDYAFIGLLLSCESVTLSSYMSDAFLLTLFDTHSLTLHQNQPHLSDYQLGKHITLALMNVQLIKNKEELVHSILEDNKVDIAVVTEMWLNSLDTDRIWIMASEIGKGDYCLSLCPRTRHRGVGVALINRKNLQSKLLSQGELSTFQFGKWQVLVKHTCLRIVAVYRPPDSSNIMFLDEITEWMVDSLAEDTNVIVAGDFNLHISNENDDDTHKLLATFAALGLDQHVGLPTHKSGNILDLIFTEGISDLSVISCKPTTFMSDHAVVLCETLLKRDDVTRKQITYRIMDNVNYGHLADDVVLDPMLDDFDLVVENFHCSLKEAFDKHIPAHTKSVSLRRKVPWFTDDVRDAKR